jgi:hypothetical protein
MDSIFEPSRRPLLQDVTGAVPLALVVIVNSVIMLKLMRDNLNI